MGAWCATVMAGADRVMGQGGVAPVRLALPNLLRTQAVGQMARADDLDAIGKNQQTNRGATMGYPQVNINIDCPT